MHLSNLIHAVDAHAAGEHGRVITGGVVNVPGATMFDKMTWLRTHGDALRLRMLREPRGYPAANCNLILPSNHPSAARREGTAPTPPSNRRSLRRPPTTDRAGWR